MTEPNTIFNAAHSGDYDKIKTAVDNDKNKIKAKDSNGRILLHWAAISGNLKLVTYLLDMHSNIEALDDTETTPIVLAASSGRQEVVKLLILSKANVNHQTTQGHSALQYAASKNHSDICVALVEAGANINVKDIRGATPLHRAASKGNTDVVKFLLSREDIQVNLCDAYGNTALHLACEEDRQEDALLLLANGAQTTIRNKDKQTPLDLCSRGLLRAIEGSVNVK